MIEQQFQTLQQQLQVLIGQCGQLNAEQFDPSVGAVAEELRTVQQGLQAASTDPNKEKTRSKLADFRVNINNCVRYTAEIHSRTAEAYRHVLGDGKASFESLNSAEQQSLNPEAYMWKQRFDTVKTMKDDLSHLTANLLTLSGLLEHDVQQFKRVPDTGDYHPDKPLDPPQSSLSP